MSNKEKQPYEVSVWQWAWSKTKEAKANFAFWVFEALLPLVVAIAAFFLLSEDATDFAKATVATGAGIVALLGGVGLIFVVYAFVAPLQQRNEARRLLSSIPGGPTAPKEPKATLFLEFHCVSNEVPIEHMTANMRPPGDLPHGMIEFDILMSATNSILVEQLELEVAGDRLISGWHSDYIDVHTALRPVFALAKPISKGVHQARLLAFAKGEWWASKPFELDFV